jgi:fructoselysine-6-P-deglycase FrlB-like protein
MSPEMSVNEQDGPSGHTRREIDSQPACWRRAAALAPAVAPSLAAPGERVAIIGCGTSWFIAQCAAALREAAGLGETDAFVASEAPLGRPYDRVIAISRSGTTTEVVRALASLPTGTPSVAVCGVADMPLATVAGESIVLGFADERSVVQTRFATTALALLRASFGASLEATIADAERALVDPVPGDLDRLERVQFLGTGWRVGLAAEAALKVREAAQAWAESYPAMDYRHGPIALAEPGTLAWFFGPVPAGLDREVAALGADVYRSELDPLAQLVLAQRLALALASHRGLDPDRPRNLTRSVVLPARGREGGVQ